MICGFQYRRTKSRLTLARGWVDNPLVHAQTLAGFYQEPLLRGHEHQSQIAGKHTLIGGRNMGSSSSEACAGGKLCKTERWKCRSVRLACLFDKAATISKTTHLVLRQHSPTGVLTLSGRYSVLNVHVRHDESRILFDLVFHVNVSCLKAHRISPALNNRVRMYDRTTNLTRSTSVCAKMIRICSSSDELGSPLSN